MEHQEAERKRGLLPPVDEAVLPIGEVLDYGRMRSRIELGEGVAAVPDGRFRSGLSFDGTGPGVTTTLDRSRSKDMGVPIRGPGSVCGRAEPGGLEELDVPVGGNGDEHPRQRQRLAAGPELVDAALDLLLRLALRCQFHQKWSQALGRRIAMPVLPAEIKVEQEPSPVERMLPAWHPAPLQPCVLLRLQSLRNPYHGTLSKLA